MPTVLNPYLSFRANAREAMEFYHSVFGGELTVSTFGDLQASQDPADADLVMHASLSTESGLALMGADTPSGMDLTQGSNFTVSLSGNDEGELRGYWDKLSEGGDVRMPLEKAQWGDTFGMCTDRFGIPWMVNIAGS
ncbi:MAG TPA: VOC family protein [Micrococcaceae bacterium]|jgi:PhnB protein